MFNKQFQDDSDFSVKKFYRRKSIKKRKNRNRSSINQSDLQQTSGKWNLKETKLYVEFLKANKDVIEDFKYRREKKVFKQMSLFVKTRTPDQCRSHHQKVQKLHKSIDDIIVFYDRKVMFGASKKIKLQSNIVLIGSYTKEQKTTQLIETQQYFNCRIENDKLVIVVKDDQIEQY